MINEAAFIKMEGVSDIAGIDTAMKLGANHPMGPLELGDFVGLDICLAIMDVLYKETGDSKYRACPLIRKMVRGGNLGCKTGKGYVLGSRFVGGLAGGFTDSGVQQNDTNSSDVFGSRYVGGIVSVNGSNSQISGMTNTGLVAAFGKNAAYVGGIVGVNDADWGGGESATATATVRNCANRMSGDNATDTRRINLLKELSSSAGGYADYVGGIAGCNGKNGVVTWDTSTPTLGAILYGNNYVGGVAGYNDVNVDDLQHLRPEPDHQRPDRGGGQGCRRHGRPELRLHAALRHCGGQPRGGSAACRRRHRRQPAGGRLHRDGRRRV